MAPRINLPSGALGAAPEPSPWPASRPSSLRKALASGATAGTEQQRGASMAETTNQIQSLILVYNADWSLLGGLQYVGEMLRGANACALCDITHNTLTEKREWRSCKAEIGVPVKALYRNQIRGALKDALKGAFPAVVAKTAHGFTLLLDRRNLEACKGDVRLLYDKVKESAAEHGLSLS
jgi:hypothetical protein